jgi:2-methylaconitate cis-trans-isomerase PrpF
MLQRFPVPAFKGRIVAHAQDSGYVTGEGQERAVRKLDGKALSKVYFVEVPANKGGASEGGDFVFDGVGFAVDVLPDTLLTVSPIVGSRCHTAFRVDIRQ